MMKNIKIIIGIDIVYLAATMQSSMIPKKIDSKTYARYS